jgi:hypothetical protein
MKSLRGALSPLHFYTPSTSFSRAMSAATRLQIESLFDAATSTFSHIAWAAASGECALTASTDLLLLRLGELDLQMQRLLDTHVHTDHFVTLSMPVLLLPSVQVNMRAGQLPPPEDNGIRYLKLPLNAV